MLEETLEKDASGAERALDPLPQTTPALPGHVQDVSADRILDPKGEKSYYLARVMVDTRELAAQGGQRLYPGMPATVFIETHQETLLDYLLSPLFGALERGMREH